MRELIQSVEETSQRLRAARNDRLIASSLFRNPWNWSRTCSALDQIDDILLAITAFVDDPSTGAGSGVRYLHLYGLLQGLSAQQDAVDILGMAFNRRPPPDKRFDQVRSIRNRCVGHACDHDDHSGKKATTELTRAELEKWRFSYLSFSEDGEMSSASVDLQALLSDHLMALRDSLEFILQELEPRIDRRRAKLKSRDFRNLPVPLDEIELILAWAKNGTEIELSSIQEAVDSATQKVSLIQDELSHRFHLTFSPGLEGTTTEMISFLRELDAQLRLDPVHTSGSPWATDAARIHSYTTDLISMLHEVEDDLQKDSR